MLQFYELIKVKENKVKSISKLKNDYDGHISTAITQKYLEYLSKILQTAYTYAHKRYIKISCNLKTVTRTSVAHFNRNDSTACDSVVSIYFGQENNAYDVHGRHAFSGQLSTSSW